jgi:hypothetical protein
MAGFSAGVFVFWVDWDLLDRRWTSRPDVALDGRLTTLSGVKKL